MVKFVKPTQEHVDYIAANMRNSDVVEIWASSHSTPQKALIQGLKASVMSAVITVNDVPCVMLGLSVNDPLSGIGSPWLLGTNQSLKHAREFLKLSPPVIEQMLERCPHLYNHVHCKNSASVRWLRWLGFTLDEPAPHGVDGELFHKFHKER